MTRHDRERIAALEKRQDYLGKRIAEGDALGRDLSYDKQEYGALRWAIPILIREAEERARSLSRKTAGDL